MPSLQSLALSRVRGQFRLMAFLLQVRKQGIGRAVVPRQSQRPTTWLRAFAPPGYRQATRREQPIAGSLIQFLERYGIPLNAFSRRRTISAWAIRQARASVRSLSVGQETLIRATMERIQVVGCGFDVWPASVGNSNGWTRRTSRAARWS